jgi:hypothetical protein
LVSILAHTIGKFGLKIVNVNLSTCRVLDQADQSGLKIFNILSSGKQLLKIIT